MNLFQLKYFLDIFQTKSFVKTAKLNRRTQPAISLQIQALEEELGSSLFDRSKHQIEPTILGSEIEPLVRSILQNCETLRHHAQKGSNIPRGHLRIATIQSVGIYELSPYLKLFLAAYPKINLHLEYRRNDEIYELLAQNVIDFGIVAYPKESKNISYYRFKSATMVPILNPKHPLTKKRWLVPKDLQDQNFVAFSPNLPTHNAVAHFLSEQGVFVKICMSNDNIDTLKNAVEIGLGLSIVPEATVQHEIQKGTLRAISFRHNVLKRPIGILFDKRKKISYEGSLFLNRVLKGKRSASPKS